ncbi:hypothetical protein [Haliangium sp.]|uniref:hypothetical protein n=1 Tax=Haliangium sp. TaxID=2663208 RepID=UPI003D108728
MSIASNVNLKGVVQIELRRRDGRVVDRVQVSNRIVDYGFDLLSRLVVSAFINDAVENFDTLPIQGIAVGTGPDSSAVPFDQTSLEEEWKRQRIEQVEILSASRDVKDAADATTNVLRFSSKIHGAYGNRIRISVLAPDGTNPYRIQVDDESATIWDGSAWVPGPRTGVLYQSTDLADLLAQMAGDPTVAVSAPDLAWSGTLATDPAGTRMSGGGGGVVVSATFNNASADTVALTEAALFTEDTAGEGVMFNMVRFPVINVTSELDITFRWKLLFQES